jgi:hypothetical protein
MTLRLLRSSLMAILFALPAVAQSAAPSVPQDAAIRQAALNYLEGLYEGDAARVERALHPDLVKRRPESRGGKSRLNEMTASQLIDFARNGTGTRTPVERRRAEVRILDVYKDSATVRVDALDWVDFIHLARLNGEWKIVNVLWEHR